jgi:hypothetical protein
VLTEPMKRLHSLSYASVSLVKGYAKNFSRTVRTKAAGQRITFYLIPIPKLRIDRSSFT